MTALSWHVCPIPLRVKPPGRIWRCAECGQAWVVRDGKWLMYGGSEETA